MTSPNDLTCEVNALAHICSNDGNFFFFWVLLSCIGAIDLNFHMPMTETAISGMIERGQGWLGTRLK